MPILAKACVGRVGTIIVVDHGLLVMGDGRWFLYRLENASVSFPCSQIHSLREYETYKRSAVIQVPVARYLSATRINGSNEQY